MNIRNENEQGDDKIIRETASNPILNQESDTSRLIEKGSLQAQRIGASSTPVDRDIVRRNEREVRQAELPDDRLTDLIVEITLDEQYGSNLAIETEIQRDLLRFYKRQKQVDQLTGNLSGISITPPAAPTSSDLLARAVQDLNLARESLTNPPATNSAQQSGPRLFAIPAAPHQSNGTAPTQGPNTGQANKKRSLSQSR